MRKLDYTFLIEDEEYLSEARIADQVRSLLKRLKLDTYNQIYVVRLTVDVVDPDLPEDDADESEG